MRLGAKTCYYIWAFMLCCRFGSKIKMRNSKYDANYDTRGAFLHIEFSNVEQINEQMSSWEMKNEFNHTRNRSRLKYWCVHILLAT